MSQDENPIRYFDNRLQKEAVKLLPGQYYATGEGTAWICTAGHWSSQR
jgi:chemotaxis protein CheD